jgi:hypothetical protein
VARPPPGASSCRPITIATSFNPRPTNCPRSTSTASDPSWARGIQRSRHAPGLEEILRRRPKNASARGQPGVPGSAVSGQGRPGTQLTSRPSARNRLRTCHWPGYPLPLTSESNDECGFSSARVHNLGTGRPSLHRKNPW